MAIVAYGADIFWISVAALVLIFALCFVMLWRLINFADRNPQAALFEGAEFLAHEHLQLGTKDTPDIIAAVLHPQSPEAAPTVGDSPPQLATDEPKRLAVEPTGGNA